MIPDLRSSRGKSTTSEIGFYPGDLEWTLMLFSDLTKLAVAVADVNQFYWNLVTYLQFNLTVLL